MPNYIAVLSVIHSEKKDGGRWIDVKGTSAEVQILGQEIREGMDSVLTK
jgi:hypothetical protein